MKRSGALEKSDQTARWNFESAGHSGTGTTSVGLGEPHRRLRIMVRPRATRFPPIELLHEIARLNHEGREDGLNAFVTYARALRGSGAGRDAAAPGASGACTGALGTWSTCMRKSSRVDGQLRLQRFTWRTHVRRSTKATWATTRRRRWRPTRFTHRRYSEPTGGQCARSAVYADGKSPKARRGDLDQVEIVNEYRRRTELWFKAARLYTSRS